MAENIRDYIDLDLNFTRHPATNDVARKFGPEAVKQSVKNLIFTNFYERPFRSYLGSGVLAHLFENMDMLTEISLKNAVKEVLENFEKRISVLDVTVVVAPDQNSIELVITFIINNTLEPVVTSVFLERIR